VHEPEAQRDEEQDEEILERAVGQADFGLAEAERRRQREVDAVVAAGDRLDGEEEEIEDQQNTTVMMAK